MLVAARVAMLTVRLCDPGQRREATAGLSYLRQSVLGVREQGPPSVAERDAAATASEAFDAHVDLERQGLLSLTDDSVRSSWQSVQPWPIDCFDNFATNA